MLHKSNCYECVHRATIPGNCHSRCREIGAKVTANSYGITSGWFCWPLDFDPIWLESCDSFSTDKNDIRPESEDNDEFAALIRLLAGR